MKKKLKKILPLWLFDFYRLVKARLAVFFNGFPSEKLLIIGITGTKGKSSTANFIWAGLTAGSIKTGLISTANLKIGSDEFLNKYHMTMPDPFVIHRFLKKCLKAGCQAAIIETTSEGIKQKRHEGINYDILVFTNLTPEHIDAHGSFEKYRQTKQTVFKNLLRHKRKNIKPFGLIQKSIIVNADSPEADNFSRFPADKKITFGTKSGEVKAENIKNNERGVSFSFKGKAVNLKLMGDFNVLNALPVLALAKILNLKEDDVIKGLEQMEIIPGRMEVIQKKPFWAVVDYAHEKISLTEALKAGRRKIKPANKLIVLLGAEGGGRDKQKRGLMGEIAARLADYVIIANVEPYDDDPMEIINDIARAAIAHGKKEGINLFKIEDRRLGIAKALSLAKKGDFVLITGKGAEQSMIIKKNKIIWDDRLIVRQELKKII